jgi:alanine racemase
MYNKATQNFTDAQHVSTVSASNTITWVEVNKEAFDYNIHHYKKIVSPALFAVVIKSNAYGHGMLPIAHFAQKNNEVDYLCTVSISEAIVLRKSGITKPILVLSILDVSLDETVQYDLDLVAFDMHQVHELNQLGKQCQKKIKIHIKIDTGLSRLGVLYTDALDFIKTIYQLPYITIQGIFTHFAESEKADQFFTDLQVNRFDYLIELLEAKNIKIPFKHASCSAAISSNFKSHYTFARAGIGVYGLWPSKDTKAAAEKNNILSLKPVLTWKTRIIQVKEVPAGTFVGYNRTFCTTKASCIATIPVGYWDGYDRKLSNKSSVVINTQQAPVIGTIAMNLTMVDVTGLDVKPLDEVILLGNYDGITADDLAKHSSTINYEFVTRINPFLPRIVR